MTDVAQTTRGWRFGPKRETGSLTRAFFPIQSMVEYRWKSAPHPTCREASGGVIFAREVHHAV